MHYKKIIIPLLILLFTFSAVNVRAKTSERVPKTANAARICLSHQSLPAGKNDIISLVGVLQPTITINERSFNPTHYFKESRKSDYAKASSLLFRFSKKYFSSYCNNLINILGHVPLYIVYRNLTI